MGATAHFANSMQRYFGPFRESEHRGPLGNPREWEDSDPGWSQMEKHYILEGLRGKDTDAALILQLNAERLETGVRFPKRKQSYVEMSRVTQNLKKYEYFHFGLTSKSFGKKNIELLI